MYAPSKQGEQPSVEVSKEFMMSPNKLHLEASLDKEVGIQNWLFRPPEMAKFFLEAVVTSPPIW